MQDAFCMSQNNGSAIGHDPATGRFCSGNSEYRAKRQRVAALAETLAADYDSRGATKALLLVAAEHLDDASRARNRVLKARSTRAAAKILSLLPRLPKPPEPTLSELLGYDEATNG
jgi:hypothetical protein